MLKNFPIKFRNLFLKYKLNNVKMIIAIKVIQKKKYGEILIKKLTWYFSKNIRNALVCWNIKFSFNRPCLVLTLKMDIWHK